MAGGRLAPIALAVVAATASARAEPAGAGEPVKDPKASQRWLAAAQLLMQRGAYYAANHRPDEARQQFERAATAYHKAIDADDDINIYADLADVEGRLGKADEAVRDLRRVVRATGVRPEVLKRATARLDDLSGRIGLVMLAVHPAGTTITIGGAELGTSPLPEPLVLLPGTYTLSFRADGFQLQEAEITVEPGSEVDRVVELQPVRVAAPPPPPVVEPPHAPPASKLPLYAGAGITGAAVVGVGIFGSVAIVEHARFIAPATSPADRASARTSGQRFALAADVSLGAAAVAAGFTLYWYRYKYRQAVKKPESVRPPPPTAKVDVVPWVQSQSGGVALAGWF